ncbi:MbtH family NRPS accessory protein (plasmid) [Streptomyces viridifaciens]|nr:MbtH family NRPS accessory protein [Streptomyces viridifaciens]
MADSAPKDSVQYEVVVNDEGQYSIWWVGRERPDGWHAEGKQGTRADCLDHIDTVWTDMRPASVRAALGEESRS